MPLAKAFKYRDMLNDARKADAEAAKRPRGRR